MDLGSLLQACDRSVYILNFVTAWNILKIFINKSNNILKLFLQTIYRFAIFGLNETIGLSVC